MQLNWSRESVILPIMSRLLATVLIASLCGGCSDDRRTPAKAYVHWKDQLVVATYIPFFGLRPPCSARWVEGQFGYWDRLPIDQCIKFGAPRRMKGLWRDDFEGSRFCQAPAKECSYQQGVQSQVWFEPQKSLPLEFQRDHFGGLYQVDFIGRRTSYPGSYGHMGVYDEEVLVDQMISIKELEAPPQRPKDKTPE